jgi:hypothetical protein
MSETPQKKLEVATERAAQAIARLVKIVEAEGKNLKPEQVQKAFGYLALTASAAQTRAFAALQSTSLSGFSLDRELPAIAPVPIATVPAPTFPSGPIALPGPITVTPAPAGERRPSVEELGGRFCKDARDARPRVPGDDRGLAAPQDDEEPTFLDEDETDPDIETE